MDLSITGSGSIRPAEGVSAGNGVNVQGGSLTLDGDIDIAGVTIHGVHCSGDVIAAGGELKLEGGLRGISAEGSIQISSGISRFEACGAQRALSGQKLVLGGDLALETPEGGKLSAAGDTVEDADGRPSSRVVIVPASLNDDPKPVETGDGTLLWLISAAVCLAAAAVMVVKIRKTRGMC